MPVRRVLVALLAAIILPVTAALALPAFTTTPKSAEGSGGQAEFFKLTTACRGSFDRVVVRAREATPGYRVRYVKRVLSDGSGDVVPLLGSKRLRMVSLEARAHTEQGDALLPRVRTPRCPNLRQVKLAGDFEGVVTLGLGLKARTGFRVFRLSNPARLVIDVKH